MDDARREVRFGAFVLDLQVPELRRRGVAVDIRATPLRLLVVLARRIGHVVPKRQLLDEVWPGVAVSEASLSTALRELRQALGDDGRRQELVQTLRHRGVRLVAPAEPTPAEPLQETEEDVERRRNLLSRLGAALFESGKVDEARAAHREAAAMARGGGAPTSFVNAVLDFSGDLAHMETAVHSAERVALLEEAVTLDAAVPPSVRARLRARLALNLAWTRRSEALQLAEEALALAREADEPEQLARVVYDVSWVRWAPEQLEERAELASEMIAAARAAGDAILEGFAHALDASVRLEQGDRAGAEAAMARAAEGVGTGRQAGMSTWWNGWRALLAVLDGRFADAERHSALAFERSREVGARNAERIRALQISWLRFDQGRIAELAPMVDGLDATLPIVRAGKALVQHAAGRHADARRAFDALVGELDGIPRDSFWMGTVATLAELAVQLGDEAGAERLYLALAPHAERSVLIGARSMCRGSAALYVGLLARCAGREEAVVPSLERAVRANARLRAVPLLARSQLELARALVDRGQEVDIPRARELLDSAAELDRGLGLHHREADVAALAARLPPLPG